MSTTNRSLASAPLKISSHAHLKIPSHAHLNQMRMLSANDTHHPDSTGTVSESLSAYTNKLLMQAVFNLHILLFAV